MKLVSDLDEEQKRYVKEGFDSDEELSIYDLLISGQTLSKEELKKVKKLAQEMLTKIKARIHELDHWRDNLILESCQIFACACCEEAHLDEFVKTEYRVEGSLAKDYVRNFLWLPRRESFVAPHS